MNILNDLDRQSATWIKIREALETRLAEHRRANDSLNLSPDRTAALRGRIAEIRFLLGEDEDAPAVEVREPLAGKPEW